MTIVTNASQTVDPTAKRRRPTSTLLACLAALASAAFPAAAAADTASATIDSSLPISGVTEDSLSASNKVQLLRNHATLEVCINTRTHPDGAPFVRQANATTWCFKGQGAGLNYPDGCERDAHGNRLGAGTPDAWKYCHYVSYGGSLVPAAKRPSMRSDGTIIAGSPIVWRVVAQRVAFANPWGIPPCSSYYC